MALTPTDQDLRLALTSYPRALALRASKSKTSTELAQLDAWLRGAELRKVLDERIESESGAYLDTDELVKLMRWKLAVSRASLRSCASFLARSARADTPLLMAVCVRSEASSGRV